MRKLLLAAEQADSVLSAREREHIALWKTRSGLDGPQKQGPVIGGRKVDDVACTA
nr:hypothetical protein OG409_36635 [Streptomyces sp. NBC_00974]